MLEMIMKKKMSMMIWFSKMMMILTQTMEMKLIGYDDEYDES